MSEKEPAWAENHQYLLDRGFVWLEKSGQYQRDIVESRVVVRSQYLSCSQSKTDPLVGTWLAAVIHNANLDAVTGLSLVVQYSEGFTSPILAYITAETRLWQRQG